MLLESLESLEPGFDGGVIFLDQSNLCNHDDNMYAMYEHTKRTSIRVTSNMAEYSQEVLVNGEDLQGLFQAATEFVRTLKNISDEQKLMFYGLFKQVWWFNVV